MSWLFFAFSGPVLWAISVHLDKYIVERFFKESNVAVLLLFTAFIGLAAAAVHLVLRADGVWARASAPCV